MSNPGDNLRTIGAKITEYVLKYGRDPAEIQLLAVSKRHSVEQIREVWQAGQRAFGENYAQEMLDKAQQLEDLPIEWHFIGPMQSNKTRKIAELASWVHTIDRAKIAHRLHDQRPAELPPLNVCIQLNISHEPSKAGIDEAELHKLAREVNSLNRLKLRGLMAIPAPETDFNRQRAAFAQVRQALESLNARGFSLDTLSMGMSNDMEAAIAEGATLLRIGTAIFGPRED